METKKVSEMRARGHVKTVADLVQAAAPTMRPPAPPPELTAEQGDEWRAVVAAMPADWFPRETHALLVQYCRHTVACRRIAQLLTHAVDVELVLKLLAMQEREGRALSSLATRMRLTQQQRFSEKRTRGRLTTSAPWKDTTL
jgi:hypothetical protein